MTFEWLQILSMAVSDFRREYLLRLPLPLAQLYSRAYNAKDTRSRHDHAYYIFEATIKLTTCVLAAAYLAERERAADALG